MLKSVLFFIFCLFAVAIAVTNPTPAELFANDNNFLQTALVLENLEIAFTTYALAQTNVTQYVAYGFDPYVYNYLQLILETEEAHAALITATLIERGQTPIPACASYNYSALEDLVNVHSYLHTEQVLQAWATHVLDGSISTIYDKDLIESVATVATVEARMTAALELILGTSPFYNKTRYVDAYFNGSVLFELIGGFFFPNCSINVTLPVIEYVTPQSSGETGSVTNPGKVDLANNDIAAMQYALTLEHLEAKFYSEFEKVFRRIDYFNAGIAPGVRRRVNVIRAHEKAHVALLERYLIYYGATPVPRCIYNFSYVTDVTTFLALAAVLENTGVMAYDGAINTINNPYLKTIATSIATIEARHAAFLNEVNGNLPFPDYFDTASSPADIVGNVSAALIISCPYNGTTLPIVLTVPVASSTTGSKRLSQRRSLKKSTKRTVKKF